MLNSETKTRDSIAASTRDEALKDAYIAESNLLEEYKLLRKSWERNPEMTALASGVKALRKCIAVLEAQSDA